MLLHRALARWLGSPGWLQPPLHAANTNHAAKHLPFPTLQLGDGGLWCPNLPGVYQGICAVLSSVFSPARLPPYVSFSFH